MNRFGELEGIMDEPVVAEGIEEMFLLAFADAAP
jgi:hypothetical protein